MISCNSVYFLTFLLNILIRNGISAPAEDPIVEINNGKLLGNIETNYYSFKGIPYAKPPLNELRFEPPEKPNNWTEILNAQKFASTCLRLELFANLVEDSNLVGTEDCLYLNVYTPNLKTEELLPTIVYIHQGGFTSGSGDDLLETRLMNQQSFVLVTFNYRLGPLGFLSTGDNEISGNMGLKDQRMVLEWVNENIKYFGGDSKKVLLIGFSAGAASVQFHLLTEGIEDLVSAAWSFSGSALNPWAIVSNPTQKTLSLGEILNCSTTTTVNLKNCLKSLPADVIVSSTKQLFVYKSNPFRIFGPVVEQQDLALKPFITSHPRDLIKAGKCTKNIPWITSFTKEDGALLSAQFLNYKENGNLYMEDLNENLYKYLPMLLYYGDNMSQEKLIEYTDTILTENGLKSGELNEHSFENLTNLFTDMIMKNGIIESIDLHRTHCNHVYSYMYDNPPPFGFGNVFLKRKDIELGTVHGDDLFLILNFPLRDEFAFRDDEKIISDKLIKMMKNFVSTGRPIFGEIALPLNFVPEGETSSLPSNVKYLEIKANENETVVKSFKTL